MNCSVTNISVTGISHTGGFIGRNNGLIVDSSGSGGIGVSGSYPVGGFACKNSGAIKQSYAAVNVHASQQVGGMTGYANSS